LPEGTYSMTSAKRDTPGKPGNASRQQTHPKQGVQSGSPELDSSDAGPAMRHRRYRDRPADEGTHGDADQESASGPMTTGTQD
jgi:hypothetical protein